MVFSAAEACKSTFNLQQKKPESSRSKEKTVDMIHTPGTGITSLQKGALPAMDEIK